MKQKKPKCDAALNVTQETHDLFMERKILYMARFVKFTSTEEFVQLFNKVPIEDIPKTQT